MVQLISFREHYLWPRSEKTCYPRDRHLNWEFLKFEQKRIHELAEWHKKFRKADKNSNLEKASLYVVPVEHNHSLKFRLDDD